MMIKIKVGVSLGSFVGKYYPFIQVDKSLDEDTLKSVMAYFILYPEERISDHFSFGFKQISEIAVKALSPGINDPGTALKAIDQLSDLFIQMMLIEERTYVLNSGEEACIFLESISFEDLLFRTLVPIREYGNEDILVLMRLFDCLLHILYADKESKTYHLVLHKFIHNMIVCSERHINNDLDKDRINERLNKINKLFNEEYKIETL